MENGCQVLIVNAAEETREVLQTALEHRGLKTAAAVHARQGLSMAKELHPDLVVLDLETGEITDDVAAQFAQQATPDQTSLVLLGSVRRRNALPAGEYVAKPYHYAPLIRRIEEILSARRGTASGQVNMLRAG